MTCSKCDTGFCYKCGGRYLDLKFFGNHLSRYSPLGCKYNFKPNRPVLRRFIRGSVFGNFVLSFIVKVKLSLNHTEYFVVSQAAVKSLLIDENKVKNKLFFILQQDFIKLRIS